MLNNGMVSFDGETDDAVQFYLQDAPVRDEAKSIKDRVSYKKSFLEIYDIQINGSASVNTSLKPGQRELDLMIHGVTQDPLKCEIKMTCNDDVISAGFLDRGTQ